MTLTFTILGCGNSAGTPAIGNHWGNCDPAEPKNARTRASAAVKSGDSAIVIDTGPDFRQQANRANLKNIAAVLYTHAHGDHIYGIDELRIVRNRTKKLVDIYGDPEMMAELKERFAYMFTNKNNGLYARVLAPHLIMPDMLGVPMTLGGIEFIPFEQDHGTCKSLGFRFGDLAYSTDMVRLDKPALETLRGIRTWIVDSAGYKMNDNTVHANLRDIYAMNEIIGAKEVYLTHLTPLMDYKTLLNETPDGYFPAYDGLEIDINSNT